MGLRSTGTAYPTFGSQLIPMLTYNSKLEEADVFLAKRTGSDMQRNSLVSGRHPPQWPVIQKLAMIELIWC